MHPTCFIDGTPQYLRISTAEKNPIALLSVSRQIYDETKLLPFNLNIIAFWWSPQPLRQLLVPLQLSAIERIELHTNTRVTNWAYGPVYGIEYPLKFRPEFTCELLALDWMPYVKEVCTVVHGTDLSTLSSTSALRLQNAVKDLTEKVREAIDREGGAGLEIVFTACAQDALERRTELVI